MRYVTLRLAGLPVGSGVTESTCKTVFGHRTKRSGQRWRVPTFRGVVTLRALLQSERLPRFWQRLSLRYAANVRGRLNAVIREQSTPQQRRARLASQDSGALIQE